MSKPAFSALRVRMGPGLAALDALVAAASSVTALALWFRGTIPPEHLDPILGLCPLLVGVRLTAAHLFGLHALAYRRDATSHVFSGIAAAFLGVGAGLVVRALAQVYYLPEMQLSRGAAVLDAVMLSAWFGLSRSAALRLMALRGQVLRVVLVGEDPSCAEVARELTGKLPGHAVVLGVVSPSMDNLTEDSLGTVQELPELLDENPADAAILVAPSIGRNVLLPALTAADSKGVDVFLHPDADHALYAAARFFSLADLPLVSLSPERTAGAYWDVKRALDATAAGVGLVVLLPVFGAVAASIRLSSKGPVFFRQERVGFEGRPFHILKFRTMRPGAEDESGPALADAADARITPVGRWLRRTRLDELPQLWNVLRGEMSLVGPRPERPEFVARFAAEHPLYVRRHRVRPGMTGLAQIHAAYGSDYAHKLRYDLVYLGSLSFTADVRILLATIRTVATGRGAR